MNELDILRKMLTDAGIPFESRQEEWPMYQINLFPDHFSGNKVYKVNQIVYGKTEGQHLWKLDGICQYGSYGVDQGLIETYGELGTDAEGDPLVLTAAEVFKIIREDWEKKK